jgi:hypothetical protein
MSWPTRWPNHRFTSLSDEQDAALQKLAKAERVPASALIREGVELLLTQRTKQAAAAKRKRAAARAAKKSA